MPCAAPNLHFSLRTRLYSVDQNHRGLQLCQNSLNSSGAGPDAARLTVRIQVMNLHRFICAAAIFICAPFLQTAPGRSPKLSVPAAASATVEKIYSFDLAGATEEARRLEREQPDHPLGYLLEAEALWWKIWCTTADFKYGMTDARRRPKLASDQHYLELAAKASSVARERLKAGETAEMRFYAGMGDAFAARLYGLRLENRNTARAGIRARASLARRRAGSTACRRRLRLGPLQLLCGHSERHRQSSPFFHGNTWRQQAGGHPTAPACHRGRPPDTRPGALLPGNESARV